MPQLSSYNEHELLLVGRKSCAITTAKRLAQFLGDDRIKDKGLNCNYVVAKRPENAPTSERAVPVAIFSTEPSVARTFLRKWVGDLAQGWWHCTDEPVSALKALPQQMGSWHSTRWQFGGYLRQHCHCRWRAKCT